MSFAAELLSQCQGEIFNDFSVHTLNNDPELCDMVSIGRAQQWELEAEWREWCQETAPRARFYGHA